MPVFFVFIAVVFLTTVPLIGTHGKTNERSLDSSSLFDEKTNRNGVTDSEILIGSSLAMSGDIGIVGTQYLDGSIVYINEINARGGIHGRKIRVIAYDDQYEHSKTVANTQKLIQSDKVFLLFDYVGTPTSVKVIGMVEDAKIPLFGLFTGAEQLRKPVNPYIFNVRASYYDETSAIVDYFVAREGFTKIAVFYQDDDFGMAGLKGTEIALMKYGLKPVSVGSYTRGSADIENGLNIIQASGPEAIVMIGTYIPLAKFVDHYRAKGFDPYFHSVSFVGAEAFGSELSKYGINTSDKIIVTEVVPDPRIASKDYLALSAKYFPGEAATYTGLEGYLTAVLLVEALDLTGPDLTRENFVRAVESKETRDVIGIPVSFSSDNHQAFKNVYLSRLHQGIFNEFSTDDDQQ